MAGPGLTAPGPQGARFRQPSVYRFRTRRRRCDLRFGQMGWVRQDRGLCLFVCST